jgi:uncharacterized protein involved in exopolysaccharide biosynthesis
MTIDLQSNEPELTEAEASAVEVSFTRANAQPKISLFDVLTEMARRKWTILRTTVGAAAVGLIAALIWPNSYSATVTLLPPQQNSSMGMALASQLGNLGSLTGLTSGISLKNPNEMYVAMLQSRTVEEAMVQRFDLRGEYGKKYISDARRALEKRCSISAGSKDGLIHIEVRDHDPRRAAELANGYVEEYRKLSQNIAIGEASQRRLFFQQQLEQAKDNLANSEEALKRTEQKTGLIQLDSQARALIESAAALRAQVAAKEVQIESLRSFATDQNAQLVQAQQELDGLRAQLAKLGGSETGPGKGLIVPEGQVTEAGLDYVRKLRDVKYYETIFEIIARQFEVAKLDEAKQGSLIQVVDAAVPAERRSFPHPGIFTVVAGFLGFIGAVCLVLLQAGYRRMQQDPEARIKLEQLRAHL